MIVAIETFTRESTEDNFISENLTKLIYNNWLLIAETDANGSVTREYFYSDDANGDAGVGKLIRFIDYTDKTGGLLSAESKNYFVINDNVGNITSVIDKQGNIINSYAYSPFGELIVEQEQVKLNIGFNTKYEDESGLIYYNNRYYDSDLGRFISQDPIFEEGGENLYNFVENDPINHWDILGYYSYTINSFDIGNFEFDSISLPDGFNVNMIMGVEIFSIDFSVDLSIFVTVNCDGEEENGNHGTVDFSSYNYIVSLPVNLGPIDFLPGGTVVKVTRILAKVSSASLKAVVSISELNTVVDPLVSAYCILSLD